jgi:hypothetical protein
MLTLFIIPSYAKNADVEKTIESFSGIDIDFKVVVASDYMEINRYKGVCDWFGIFWDNERIDDGLKGALPVFLSYPNLELLILYKKEGVAEATWRVRMFRRKIYLLEDYCPLCMWANKEIVLDGWILEHDNPS